MEEVGNSDTGSFWNRPFSGSRGSWCVKGGSKNGGIWECGDNLDALEGNKFETNH